MRGGGVAGSQPVSIAVYITWHGAQINFVDLTPNLPMTLPYASVLRNRNPNRRNRNFLTKRNRNRDEIESKKMFSQTQFKIVYRVFEFFYIKFFHSHFIINLKLVNFFLFLHMNHISDKVLIIFFILQHSKLWRKKENFFNFFICLELIPIRIGMPWMPIPTESTTQVL